MLLNPKKHEHEEPDLYPTHVDTIVALATPMGRGGISVVRVSGKSALAFSEIILGKKPRPRTIEYLPFLDEKGNWIDRGIVLFFKGPHSLTGEDVVEFQGHGGPVVVERLIQRLLQLGAKLANPGEFLERAFLNNKVDLLQVEAIHDLIQANTETAARCAARSLQGVFAERIEILLNKLIHLRMYIEAAIDFPEEELDLLSEGKVGSQLEDLQGELEKVLTASKQGAVLAKGFKVVIAGKPNAGKSSLLNALAGYDSAIVTDIPGTTRDVLREQITLDGFMFQLSDTAGLRVSQDVVESEGILRAEKEMRDADHIVWVVDASGEQERTSLSPHDYFKENNLQQYSDNITLVYNKMDMLKDCVFAGDAICLSVKTGEGIDLLKEHLKKILNQNQNDETLFFSRQRHVDALCCASEHLNIALNHFTYNKAYDLIAEELRLCQLSLDEIMGKFTSDDLLGKIFSEFCIGK